jgi:hypothetical protein
LCSRLNLYLWGWRLHLKWPTRCQHLRGVH